MSELPEPELTAETRLRVEAHLEQALEICEGEETQYHLREALHLLTASDGAHEHYSTES